MRGEENGSCKKCQASPANWYDHRTRHWYCLDCSIAIGQSVVKLREWLTYHYHIHKHSQFETRSMMNTRVCSKKRCNRI